MGLKFEDHPCWIPTCDECGEGDNSEYGTSFHYESEAEAIKSLEGFEWTKMDDGRWLCFGCAEELEVKTMMTEGS